MKEYAIFYKKTGEILHVHSVFDGSTGTFIRPKKEEILSTLSDFIPEPETVDIIEVDIKQSQNFYKMRVDPNSKKLEAIETKRS